MISQSKNRVQAIKSKFENLGSDSSPLVAKKHSGNISQKQLCKQSVSADFSGDSGSNDKENSIRSDEYQQQNESDTSSDEWSAEPNLSYLYSKNEVKRSVSDTKKSLVRQISDPGKKLHRSHAFRCDRSQKIVSPKRHGSCNGRSETSDFSLKMGEKKLSKDRLKQLGNLLEEQMRKENFVPANEFVGGEVGVVPEISSPVDSIPDSDVPQHILDQYAKVIKPKKKEDKQDAMTDSGVSSETENVEEEKSGRIKKLMSQFEKPDPESVTSKTNLDSMNDLCISSETMRLERKNPHLILTDTLKKALKQPLPPGPPPKKPPRIFTIPSIPENPESPEKQKKDTKKMLEKLEKVLQKREQTKVSNEYDIAETNLSLKKPKEVHYLCTEILDITHRTLLPNQNLNNCFKSLNCAITNNSTLSLPYTRLNGSNRNSLQNFCSCSHESVNLTSLTTFLGQDKCTKCQTNDEKHNRFKCHLNCNCVVESSRFFVEKEHIYDEPFVGDDSALSGRRSSKYGTLNQSKSLEELRTTHVEVSPIFVSL